MSEAYLLFGPEEGKKQDWIIEKKKEILSLHPDSEVVLLFTFETDAETLADALSSSSLFSSYKLVFLKNFDDVKKGPLLNELIKYLKERGIGSIIHYPIPPHLSHAYAYLGHHEGDYPITEKYAKTVLSLPMYNGYTEEEQDYVINCLNEFK